MLDIADLVRDTVTIPCAFKAAAIATKRPGENVERLARRMAGERLKRDGVIGLLIDRIKTILSEPETEQLASRQKRPSPQPQGEAPQADSGEPEGGQCP